MENTKKLLLLLIAFISININAETNLNRPVKSIDLKRYGSNIPPKKGTRSIILLEASAYLDLDGKLLIIDSYIKDCLNVSISVNNFTTNEIVYSGLYLSSDNIVLNMEGLLIEDEVYRLEITFGETVLYGDFSL